MVVEHAAAAAAAHHAVEHASVIHSVFVKMMHNSVGGMAASALLAGIWAEVTTKVEEDEEKSKAEEEEEDGKSSEDAGRVTPTPAEQICQRRKTSIVLAGAAMGAVGGLVMAVPAARYGWSMFGYDFCLRWRHCFTSVAKATAFQALPVGMLIFVGPGEVADRLPASLGGMVAVSAALSCVALPLNLVTSHHVEYYLAAMRVATSGASSVLVCLFATRYAGIQRRKVVSDPSSTVENINTGAITVGQFAGYALSATWLWIGMTEWAGRVYPEWVHELPEVYFIASMVHMLAPSPHHDTSPGTLMTRSALVGGHALLFIPEFEDPTMHTAQMMLGLAMTAGWFGTFEGEWRRDATSQHVGEEHADAEKAEVTAQGAEAIGRASHACSIM